ncbi:M16 family metallopeptidase [Alkalicoccus luteus]|uniref:Insulinase family protein n=1 Tax=Alkalicoccus luteus TaxID=1237094 RepID=A0A969PQW6_9BACI|nr:pitrilysin family protein [Alkalicoccus luteus]NJP36303.1 insulinase family protein [Alkalicoccus luteus]
MEKRTLSNNVRLVLEKDTSIRSVSAGIWVSTGSRFEQPEENGSAHFIEHMLFKGTKQKTASEIAEAFDAMGGYVNAMTSKEYTAYYAKVLDTHAASAVALLTEMFFESRFDAGEMEKEKQVVLEEIHMYDDTPDDLVHEMLAEAAFGRHPIAAPILGTEETLISFNESRLRDFMKRHYGGERLVISIAGNFTDELVDQVSDAFTSSAHDGEPLQLEKPVFQGNVLTKKKKTEQAHLCFGYEGVSLTDDTIYSAVLLNNVLGGNMSSRLFQEIREERGLAYAVYSMHEAFRDTGLLTIYAGTHEKHLDETVDIIKRVTNDVKENGLTEKELTNAKEQLKGNLLLSLESSSSRMNRNAKNELFLGRSLPIDEMVEAIDAVSMHAIQYTARLILHDNPAVSLVSTAGSLPASLRNRTAVEC